MRFDAHSTSSDASRSNGIKSHSNKITFDSIKREVLKHKDQRKFYFALVELQGIERGPGEREVESEREAREREEGLEEKLA